ncbi:hypothetical protein H5410_017298 [Solanum commersonii]|uniref:Uncharacterized protein n=1 Tax=Solanum commersonii TaxID=4109 RepID=A0A9J5ZZL6_SOLCO|nr:hypothetical protein H5410_017298 [Solanum commersonii]
MEGVQFSDDYANTTNSVLETILINLKGQRIKEVKNMPRWRKSTASRSFYRALACLFPPLGATCESLDCVVKAVRL